MVTLSVFFAFSLIGIIIGGIATLITVVFTIISLVSGKNNNAAYWTIGFVVSLAILIFSIVQFVQHIENKVKSGIEWVVKNQPNALNSDNTFFDTNYSDRETQLDSLKAMVDEKYKKSIPHSFYENPKEPEIDQNNDTLPFIYPYAFEFKESALHLIDVSRPNETKPIISTISQLAFDRRFLLTRIDRTNTQVNDNEPEVFYILFDMKNGTKKQFLNSSKLMAEATAMGYTGSKEMQYIKEMYKAWYADDYD